MSNRLGKFRKVLIFEFELELFRLHAWEVKGMSALIEHHKHDYCAGPDVYRLRVRRFVEDLGGHEEKGTALGFHVFGVMHFEFCGEAEVHDFNGGEIVVILKQYVF